MKALSITDIITATGGELIGQDDGRLVIAVSTDTRNLPDGCLFVALRGDNFDAHDFLQQAIAGGAGCILIDQRPSVPLSVPAVLVEDTLCGLQRLAKWYRDHLNVKVIGITGSNGKTSTKDFTASVIAEKFRVNATKGNLNNHIGLPLSVLSTEELDEVCILEMGMNHAGEIAPLCEIASPGIGMITNVGTAHIEFLGSRENIAEEKSALARSLTDKGTLIIPADCDFASYMMEHTAAKVLVAGNGRGAVRAEDLEQTESGSTFQLCVGNQVPVAVSISVSGKHMVSNALIAAAAGHALGMNAVEIAAGLNKATLTGGRLGRYQYDGITVIDDTYNANPDSVIAAIDTLADLAVSENGNRVIALGMMGELGVHADSEHKRVGKVAAQKGLCVISVGEKAELIYRGASSVSDQAKHFNDHSEAADWLQQKCRSGDLVLLKGSRMAAMEKVMNQAFPQL